MAKPQSELSALFAKSAFEFSDKPTTLSSSHITPQAFTCGASRALITSGRLVSRPAVGRGFGEGRVGPAPPKSPPRFCPVERRPRGALCIYKRKGPQGVGRRKT